MISALLLAAALPLASPETPPIVAERPIEQQKPPPSIFGSFELRLAGYRPNIDAEFGGATPFADAFGNGRALMFRAHVARALWHQVGTLEAGLGVGYTELNGHGRAAVTGEPSADTTTFRMVPLSISLTYRFDWAVDRYGFPLVPYGRISFERYQWWARNGSGKTSTDALGHSGSGATNGYSFTGGVAFLLDFLDPGMAHEMEQDTGIHDTYLYFDLTKSYVSDFHSAKSWDLSDDQITLAGGILLVF